MKWRSFYFFDLCTWAGFDICCTMFILQRCILHCRKHFEKQQIQILDWFTTFFVRKILINVANIGQINVQLAWQKTEECKKNTKYVKKRRRIHENWLFRVFNFMLYKRREMFVSFIPCSVTSFLQNYKFFDRSISI